MEPIVLFQTKEQCSGCGACMVACPKGAIEMAEDEFGAVYPRIRSQLCIGCGKCIRVCSMQPALSQPAQTYGALTRDEEIYRNSASGGVFASLAYRVLEQGGLVAGAVLDLQSMTVKHILSHRTEDIRAMQGSKYVQSDAAQCYGAVLSALQADKTVLFSGTPCQVQAIKNLTGDPENLITMDLICHGVPPMAMLRDFLKLQGKRLRGSVSGFTFRDKTAPKPFTARLQVSGRSKSYRIRSGYLSYYRHFLEGVTYRQSCYSCPFAGEQRAGDLTIGDYWGVEKHHADQLQSGEIPAGRDISCVLVSSQKGRQFLRRYGQTLQLWQSDARWVAETNQQLCAPSQKHPDREAVLQAYQAGGYAAVEKQFIKGWGGKARYFYRLAKSVKTVKTEN